LRWRAPGFRPFGIAPVPVAPVPVAPRCASIPIAVEISMQTEMRQDGSGQPYDERTVRAIIALLEASKHNVHKGAAKRVAEYFLPDGRIERAQAIASAMGWPLDAVLAGVEIGGAS
jgi:hypothetical protein